MSGKRRAGRGGLAALGTLAAGAAAGLVAEELVYRRLFGGPDPAAAEAFGSLRGDVRMVRSFDGTLLATESFGPPAAPALVLLHGVTLCRTVWHYQLRDLPAAGWRVIAYDARGHGASGAARGPSGDTPFSASTLARDLHAVLEAWGVQRAALAGHSMGGMTVLQFCDDFAAELGGRVQGVALLNTTYTADLVIPRRRGGRLARLRGAGERLVGWLASDPRRLERLRMPPPGVSMLAVRLGFGERASPTHVALTRAMIRATPTETIAAALAGLASYDTRHVLRKVGVPALVVAGSRDLLTPPWLSREMARRMPRAELVVFEGAGHMVMLERHAELSRLLDGFGRRVLS